jgi:hypothetical protein
MLRLMRDGDLRASSAMGAVSAASSVRGKKLRVELLIYLHHLLVAETAAGGELGDRFKRDSEQSLTLSSQLG